MTSIPTLALVCEQKIRELMPSSAATKRWEASGVMVKENCFLVVFDNRTQVARISAELQSADTSTLLGIEQGIGGYEGIAYSASKKRFYLLVECRKHPVGYYRAEVVECNENFEFRRERPLDFTFKSGNKGFEAITYLYHNDKDHLLGLCEGNLCKCGKKGRKPGGGRVQVFEKSKKRWRQTGTIALPASLPFVDYSGMAVDGSRVAVVSQESSMLWVGQFNGTDWTWKDEGRLYNFPRTESECVRYGNIEGVAWINPSRIVVVSDRRKRATQPDKKLSEKDQSIHIFDIPT